MVFVGARAQQQDGHFKDSILAALAGHANVDQFVSFEAVSCDLRYCVINEAPQAHPQSVEGALELLLSRSPESSVNIRAFHPEQPKSHEFIYGLSDTSVAAAHVRRLAGDGLFTIANETIDVNDGGVSGVAYAQVLEFAPEDTPRAVEKPGTAALPTSWGLDLLETVYGFRPALTEDPRVRVEFSIHPLRCGYRHDHTIVWEEETYERVELPVTPSWPNRFSRFIGDKVFGLLVADAIGLNVPRATVVCRRVAPFNFGQPTGTRETWIRTAPTEQVPGRFTTRRGWADPYAVLGAEDPSGSAIAAVIAQEGVDAHFSGVAAGEADGGVRIEGVSGYGEGFMLGKARPIRLPAHVVEDVSTAYDHAASSLGAARFEWVHDGERAWVVQLHRGALPGKGRVIYPGTPSHEHYFAIDDGLEALRELVVALEGSDEGVVLVGAAGVTSHLGDILRRARIPSRIEPAP